MDRSQITYAFNLQNELAQKKAELRDALKRAAALPDEIDRLERLLNDLGLPALPVQGR